jgi:hypothetical protein
MTNIVDMFTKEELTEFRDTGDGNLRGPCIGGCCSPETGIQYDCLIRPETNDVWCFSCAVSLKLVDVLAVKQGRRTCSDFA